MRQLIQYDHWRRLMRLLQDVASQECLTRSMPLLRGQFEFALNPPFGLAPACIIMRQVAAAAITKSVGPFAAPVEIYPVSLAEVMRRSSGDPSAPFDMAAAAAALVNFWPTSGVHDCFGDLVRWQTRDVAYGAEARHRIPELTRLLAESRRDVPLAQLLDQAGFGPCFTEPLRRWLMAALMGNIAVMEALQPIVSARGRFMPLRNAGYDRRDIWFVLFA